MTTRVKCNRCDRMILESTAKANNGLCAPCFQVEDRRAFDEIVEGWIRNPGTLPGTNGIPEPDGFALRLRASQLRAERTSEGKMDSVCDAFFGKALAKWSKRGAAALSEKEKHVLGVETFYGEVENGGLRQYLDNQPAFAKWAADGFDRIAIPEYATVMRRVASLFPSGIIPEDDDECSRIIDGLDDQVFEEIENDFWSRFHTDEGEIRCKLYAYIMDKQSNKA